MQKKISYLLLIGTICAIGLAVRLYFLIPARSLEAEPSIAALCAKHIMEFKEFPIFRPYSHYVGLLNSYIGAVLFKFFGISTLAWSMIGLIYSCGWILLIYLLAKKTLPPAGIAVALMLACLPSGNTLIYSLYNGGINGETFILETLLLLILIKWDSQDGHRDTVINILGFISGLGLWLTPQVVPAMLTVLTVIFMREEKRNLAATLARFFIFFFLGYLPTVIYNFQHPGAQLMRFAGRTLNLDRSVLASPDIKQIVLQRILWRLSLIPHFLFVMFKLSISLNGLLPFLMFLAGTGLAVKEYWTGRKINKKIGGFSMFLILICWFTIFYATRVDEEHIRYMIPLAIILPLFLGKVTVEIKERSKLLFAFFVAMLLFNNAFDLGKTLTTREASAGQELGRWLKNEHIHYAYGEFLTAYIVEFQTQEGVLISPTLTHPDFFDCWPEQTKEIRNAPETVFILNGELFPRSALALEKRLNTLGIQYRKNTIKEFLVYDKLSKKIYPEELQLPFRKSKCF